MQAIAQRNRMLSKSVMRMAHEKLFLKEVSREETIDVSSEILRVSRKINFFNGKIRRQS